MQHHGAGQLQQAEALYNQVLRVEPNQPVALHLLGVLACQSGHTAAGADLIAKAVGVQPDYAEAHGNLAVALKDLGRLDDAIESCRKALALNPEFVDAHNTLGDALLQKGRADDAVQALEQALKLGPGHIQAWVNLGNARQAQDRLDDAVRCYQKALEIHPDIPQALNNLGNALVALGQAEDALAHYQRAVTLAPGFAEAHHNLAGTLFAQGRVGAAVEAHHNALALQPDNDAYWQAFAATIDGQTFNAVNAAFIEDLLGLLARGTVRPTAATQAVISLLRLDERFQGLLDLDDDAALDGEGEAEHLSANAVLLAFMALAPISDVAVERVMTRLRRALLNALPESLKGLPFAAALALQCFTNEYVYGETAEEAAQADALADKIAKRLEGGRDVAPMWLAVLGAYRPLCRYAWAQDVMDDDWPEALASVLVRQVAEPLAERAAQDGFARLTAIDDAVSQSVRAQYEENPYPRWVATTQHVAPRSIGQVLGDCLPSPDLGDLADKADPDILIAGCGTGRQAAECASRFAGASILAVDLSLASLAYAQRQCQALGHDQIAFAQGDILKLGEIGRQFDLIESVGVLHHLGDPMAGWRVLVDLLRPGGVMLIALYSETARQGVVQGRDLIAQKGYDASPADIRRCRQDIIDGPEGGALAGLMDSYDFYSLSDCRDLLFHVQEHRFTLPQVAIALDDLGLDFLGLEIPGQRTLDAFRADHPDPADLLSLDAWHTFEQAHPDTFIGMYQFWCRKPG